MPIDSPRILGRIKTVRVDHPDLAHAQKGIETCVARAPFMGKSAPCAVLTGSAGVGKTTLGERLVERYALPTDRGKGMISKKVGAFYLEVPSPITINTLASDILENLGDPTPDRGNAKKKTRRIGTLLKASSTKLVLLDEFQHLFAADSGSKCVNLTAVRNWLKTLAGSIGIPIVLIGMPQCESLIDGDPQIARRFFNRFRLGNLPLRSLENKPLYQGFLASFAKHVNELGDVRVPAFTGRNEAIRSYAVTKGNPDTLWQLFDFAVTRALDDGRTTVTMDDFTGAADAPSLVNTRCSQKNPFASTTELHALEAEIALYEATSSGTLEAA